MSTLALITGASGGIGLELAREMAKAGHSLVLVARSREKLEALALELSRQYGTISHVVDLDLSRPESALELYNQCQTRGLAPEILVNNAGFGETGPVVAQDPHIIHEMIHLNIETLTLLCRYFAADFVAKKSGRILNVASTAAFQPGPYFAVYYATKAYVLSFSEALEEELRGTGVTVTTLCPGPTLSGFQERAHLSSSAAMISVPWLMNAHEVAVLGYKALKKGCGTSITGFMNWLVAFSNRFAPRRLSTHLAGRLNRAR
jgi:short-subunit dehydrogenase